MKEDCIFWIENKCSCNIKGIFGDHCLYPNCKFYAELVGGT